MSYIFNECSSLKELNLSNFDTTNATNMNGIFSGCAYLNNLNISNFKIENFESSSNMFDKCNYFPQSKILQEKFDKNHHLIIRRSVIKNHHVYVFNYFLVILNKVIINKI